MKMQKNFKSWLIGTKEVRDVEGKVKKGLKEGGDRTELELN